jgi:hypothetical protein
MLALGLKLVVAEEVEVVDGLVLWLRLLLATVLELVS